MSIVSRDFCCRFLGALWVVGIQLAAVGLAQTAAPKVQIAGTGAVENINLAIDEIVGQLRDGGVSVALLGSDGNFKNRTAALEKMSSTGAESLIYITLDLMAKGQLIHKPKLIVQCFDSQGKILWAEEGGIGTGFGGSEAGQIKRMLKSIQPKLARRIGQPGLPKS